MFSPIRSLASLSLLALVSLAPAVVSAAIPDPTRTVIRLSDPQTVCHYRFSPATAEVLTVWVTARDAFDTPVPDCPATVGLTSPDPSFADCCGVQVATTNSVGAAQFTFRGIGGRGTLHVNVTLNCVGASWFDPIPVEFTSTNLNGSADGVTNIFDAAIFAGALGTQFPLVPADVYMNFDCDEDVDIIDASYLAGGLGLDCGAVTCP